MTEPYQYQVVEWLANGETGTSSETMAFWLGFSVRKVDGFHPLDPADFDRCLRLLEAAPELRDGIHNMRYISASWAALVSRWEELEACHVEEVGIGWTKARSAPRTYELMKAILATAGRVG